MHGRKKAFTESVSHILSLTHCEICLYDPFFLFSHNFGIIISKMLSCFTGHKMGGPLASDQVCGPRTAEAL